jgi:hypothetical protein
MAFEGNYSLPANATLVSEAPPAGEARPWACSLFAAMGGQGTVYGRNFDWQMSPALLLYTSPPDRFSSVSIVDIAYLLPDEHAEDVADLPLAERAALLDAPYWPFDGMNEHGLVVGMAAVPESPLPEDPERPDIGSLVAIRLMLDLAKDVDEAVRILRSYDVLWEGGPALHYLIADGTGRAALVEYVDGQMVVLASEDPWHLATNHLRTRVSAGQSSGCWRYDSLAARLSAARGEVGPAEAMDLLQIVSQPNTQWSVVYDTERSQVTIVLGRRFGSPYTFTFLGQLASSLDDAPTH